MDKLHKTWTWLWRNKERIFLAALVVFLCERVYRIAQGEEQKSGKLHRPPSGNVPESWQSGPPPPSVEPSPLPKPPYEALVKNNPFTVFGGEPVKTPDKGMTDQIDVKLVKIVQWKDGEYRAELLTKVRRPKRYKEGEQFENYRLERIDPANNSVDIWSEQLGKTVTLKVSG